MNERNPEHGTPSEHSFDRTYWEHHWDPRSSSTDHADESAPNPYLVEAATGLAPGTALDAGCGTGAEAIWLASHGWQVTAADISSTALERAAARAEEASVSDTVTWVEADLTTWEPAGRFDLVVTSYAHPAMPQLDFYERIAGWVAPRGTLLLIGHLHEADSSSEGHQHEHDSPGSGHPPAEATVTLADITGVLGTATWRIDSGEERTRDVARSGESTSSLSDVIVRATRRD